MGSLDMYHASAFAEEISKIVFDLHEQEPGGDDSAYNFIGTAEEACALQDTVQKGTFMSAIIDCSAVL